ncbi:MAG: hypothetical protein ACYDDI_15760 [Candidatus Acidiferrales bacterium]
MDTILMTRWADRGYFLGGEPDGPVGLFSPNKKVFVVVLKKGDLEDNTNQYSVLLFQTSEALHSPRPKILVSMSSSSTRPAISSVKWLRDSQTIAFLGENSGEIPQVYSLNIQTRDVRQLTNHRTPIVAYDISPDGREILYEADPPRKGDGDTGQIERKYGVVISTQNLTDLLGSNCQSDQTNDFANKELFIQTGHLTATKISTPDYLTQYLPLSLSPNGRYALLAAYARDIPRSWAGYQDPLLYPYIVAPQKEGIPSNLLRYLLLNTENHVLTPLINAPVSWFTNGFAWSSDGNSLVVSGTYLPLDVHDPIVRQSREKHTFLVEVDLPDRKIVNISDEDTDLKIAKWDRATGKVLLRSGYSWKKLSPVAYKKVGSTWKQVPVTNEDLRTKNPLHVTLDEDMNTPPTIAVSDSKTHRKALLLDLNPQFRELRFAKAETIRWKATDGHEVGGGLYLPSNYAPDRRYPLVIQTHGFKKDRFWINGPWDSAFAGQPLTAAGMIVLQVGNSSDPSDDLKYVNTPEEAPRQMAAYQGAIDYLDRRRLIDRNRVGIIGFSRTVFDVEYTLTHSQYHFAAATVADGFDGGYMNFLFYGGTDYIAVNGGHLPFGASMKSWIQDSPGFNLDKVRTPVRLEYYGRGAFLGGWQWFSGLSLLRKPVDFIWLPCGSHLLVKPWDRLVSEQGNVDWFSFWLEGKEDRRRAKKQQYIRWSALRSLLKQSHESPDILLDR